MQLSLQKGLYVLLEEGSSTGSSSFPAIQQLGQPFGMIDLGNLYGSGISANSAAVTCDTLQAHLECIGGRHSGEALGVVGSGADAVEAILGVVDGEHDLGPPQAVVDVAVPVCLRCACRAPVMAVQDVRLPARLQQKLQRRLQHTAHSTSRRILRRSLAVSLANVTAKNHKSEAPIPSAMLCADSTAVSACA